MQQPAADVLRACVSSSRIGRGVRRHSASPQPAGADELRLDHARGIRLRALQRTGTPPPRHTIASEKQRSPIAERESFRFRSCGSRAVDDRLGLFLELPRELAQLIERITNRRQRAPQIVGREAGLLRSRRAPTGSVAGRSAASIAVARLVERTSTSVPFVPISPFELGRDLFDLRARRREELPRVGAQRRQLALAE